MSFFYGIVGHNHTSDLDFFLFFGCRIHILFGNRWEDLFVYFMLVLHIYFQKELCTSIIYSLYFSISLCCNNWYCFLVVDQLLRFSLSYELIIPHEGLSHIHDVMQLRWVTSHGLFARRSWCNKLYLLL